MTFFGKSKYCIILLTCCLFSAIMFSSLYAAQDNHFAVEHLTMKMELKGSNSFFYQEKQFFIDKKTIIIDTYSKKTDFASLKFPCIAKIRYRVGEDNRPVCEKIVIKRYLKKK